MTPLSHALALPVPIGAIVAGKYRVESILGTGAMGVVVGARHIALEHVVAIKLLLYHRYGSRDESIARFLSEARAAARIDSDHVARVFDVGILEDGTPYMVMERLDGNDLEAELQARGPLPVAEAVDVVLQAADAIAAAHQLGIVHRDLKPANLFLAVRADGLVRVKVLDFGISKTASERGSHREDGSFGTPAYMSPEQIRDPAGVDARSDVWALGAILYELLTGYTAFVRPTISETLASVLEEDPRPIHSFRRDVPPELEAIVARCLVRDRDRRWLDAADLARALVPFGLGGSSSLIPTTSAGAPSMEPMVANAVRETATTQPDPAELFPRGAPGLRAPTMRRATRDAALLLSSVALLVATIVILWQLSTPRPRAAASAPAPPAASIAPPIAHTVQSTTNIMQNTPNAAPATVQSGARGR